jgi:hypothetical protein
MNAQALYLPTGFTGILSHGWQRPKVARDGSEAGQELEALVRSGDYFVTVATELDSLGRETTDYGVKIGLENVVSDLIHLQDNYTIIKKNEQAE